MHVPACVGVQGETSSENGQVGRKWISWVTFLVEAKGTAAPVIRNKSCVFFFDFFLFNESQQTNYKGCKKLHFSHHWTTITISLKASKCLFKSFTTFNLSRCLKRLYSLCEEPKKYCKMDCPRLQAKLQLKPIKTGHHTVYERIFCISFILFYFFTGVSSVFWMLHYIASCFRVNRNVHLFFSPVYRIVQ